MIQAFVVVVHRNRQHALGMLLTNHIIVQNLADIARGRHAISGLQARRLGLFANDVHAKLDTFVTDKDGRAGDQLSDFVLALAAEGTIKRVLAVAGMVRHVCPQTLLQESLGEACTLHNVKSPPSAF